MVLYIIMHLVVLVSSILLLVTVLASCGKEKPAAVVNILKWVTPCVAAAGYGLLTLTFFAEKIINFIYASLDAYQSLTIGYFLDLRGIVFIIVAILISLTFLFVGIWVANPFKKEQKS